MPLYSFMCTVCDHVDELLDTVAPDSVECSFCGSRAARDFSKEGVVIRGDIEPGYNESLGMQIGSRRELREALALHNAASPDLMMGSYPADGRITSSEERTEAIQRESRSGNSVFDKRRNTGWRANEGTEHIVDEEIVVEGKADYAPIISELKKRHRSPIERVTTRRGGS